MSILKRIGAALLALLIGATPVAAYNPNSGYSQPVINTTFSQAVANLPVIKDYVFGSSAAPSFGQTPVRNLTDLGSYFNPYEVNTGTVTVNSELERYQDFTHPENFVFQSNNLQLTGTLRSGTSTTLKDYGVIGGSSGSTNSFLASLCGLSNTNNVSVGQLFVQTFIGIYNVTSVNSTTITSSPRLGSGTSLGPNLPCLFTGMYYAQTNAATTTGSSVLNFAAVPSGVVAGQTVAFENSSSSVGSSKEYTVVSTTATTVNISPPLAGGDSVTSGKGIYFCPGIHSGQLWTKATYNMPGQNGATYFAMELTAQLPQNGNGYFNPATANTNGAFGAWPAFWLRGDYVLTGGQDNYSELDVFELYNDSFRTQKLYNTNLISPPVLGGGPGLPQLADFLLNPPLWSVTGTTTPNYYYNSPLDYSLAVHKYQLEFTPDRVICYIDGQMIKSVPWHWTSQASPQIGINLAIGSLQTGLGPNGLFPINDLNFPETYNLYELKIWGK